MEGNCEICDAPLDIQAIRLFMDTQCPNCGQKYEYDERHRIVLTAEQLALLREQRRKAA